MPTGIQALFRRECQPAVSPAPAGQSLPRIGSSGVVEANDPGMVRAAASSALSGFIPSPDAGFVPDRGGDGATRAPHRRALLPVAAPEA